MENRIEPWGRTSATPFDNPLRHVRGTAVHYKGLTLRARGEYSDESARALVAAYRHMKFEGYA